MRIFLGLPQYSGNVNLGTAMMFDRPLRADSVHDVIPRNAGGSILTNSFNKLWAEALDMYDAGEADAFAMIHADVAPKSPGWLDVLDDMRVAYGADIISAAIPIKDDRGVSSTSVDDTGDEWRPRRLTQHQLNNELPVTFGDAEVGGEILLNTGLWLVRLGPWAVRSGPFGSDVTFATHDLIRMEGGKRRARCKPEDWDFSRQCRARGLKLAATKAVPLKHYGEQDWDSEQVWGWKTDIQNAPPKVSPTGAWLEADVPDGFLHDAPLADALAEMFAEKGVIDLGCGRGAYVSRFRELGIKCNGVDGNPETPKINRACTVVDLSKPYDWNAADWVLSLEVGEHIPAEYQDAFIRNIDRANTDGVVISWAVPGQDGTGHVNCKSNADIKAIFAAMGYANDTDAEQTLRGKATLPYFKHTLMVFRKAKTEARQWSNGTLQPASYATA